MSGPIGLMLADDATPTSSGPKLAGESCGGDIYQQRYKNPKICPDDLEGYVCPYYSTVS